MDYTPTKAYLGAPGFFWGIPGRRTELFEIALQNPTLISRVIIISGLPVNELDPPINLIHDGQVEVCPSLESANGCNGCKAIGNFTNGEVDTILERELSLIQCLRVIIITGESKGIIIREIELLQ